MFLYSNEQLRDGLLSLVHSYSLLENKLDRHEQRERALGDVIKRFLITIQKGQQIFEPMRGTFSRLDERISQIETSFLAQDEKYTEQQNRVTQTLETILKLLIDKTATMDPTKSNKKSDESDEDDESLAKKVEDLSDNVKGLRQQIGELAADKGISEETSKGLLAQTEKLVNSKLASADDVISAMEERLTHFYVTGPVSTPPPNTRNADWEESITTSLSDIKTNVVSLKENLKLSTDHLQGLDKEFFSTVANETLEAIEDMRTEVLTASDKSFTKISTRIKEATSSLDNSISDISKTITDSPNTSDTLAEDVNRGFKELKSEINALGKLEKILLETGDNVLSIKRGMEFNVHAITLEIGDLVKTNGKVMNSTLHKK